MKHCPVCNKEVDDEAKFCPSCGAQLENPEKKLTWGEKRKKRMIEEQQQLDAAVLHDDELQGIPTIPIDNIKISPSGETKQLFNKNIIICVINSLLILICLAMIVIFRFMEINQTLKVFLVFFMFMIFSISLAFLTNSIYAVRMLNNMKKSDFAIKKLEFGKPPKMNVNGKLYTLTITSKCSMCDCQSMHIEELNGKFVAVCDQNRLHLLLIDTIKLKNKVLGITEEPNDETKENLD